MCDSVDVNAFSELSTEFYVRSMRKEELPIWKSFPFDDAKEAEEQEQSMTDFFNNTYKEKEDEFFLKTKFICDKNDKPIGTCMLWKAYGEFNTIHWLKVLKEAEGNGIGRALFSIIMKEVEEEGYPVYLHTQPSSFRAIKLYSDFGFDILIDDVIGMRENGINDSLPILKEFMPEDYFNNLRYRRAPKDFVEKLSTFRSNDF